MPLPPDRVDYYPINNRPKIQWPGNARVALWVSPNVEHYEYLPSPKTLRNAWPRTPHPDVQQYSYRDYGNRVGFWRMVEVLDRYNIRCCVSLSVSVLDHFPEVRDAMVERDYDFMSHGIYNTRYLFDYNEEEEREFYNDCIDTIKRHTGKRLKGMLGPSITGSHNTPDLMAEAGLIYHTDWIHDDQPVPIKVRSGKLVSVPYTLEINDVPVFEKGFTGEYFAQVAKDQFDRLYREGAENGMVMCIALHPYLIGQPHNIKYLDQVLDYIMSHDGVWQTTADEIAEYYIANYYDQTVAHAQKLNASAQR